MTKKEKITSHKARYVRKPYGKRGRRIKYGRCAVCRESCPISYLKYWISTILPKSQKTVTRLYRSKFVTCLAHGMTELERKWNHD